MNKILNDIVTRYGCNSGFDVTNPATNEKIITLANNSKDDVVQYINKAHNSQKEWQSMTAKQRSQILRKWFDLLIEHTDELAEIITIECGKPLTESKGEVAYASSFVEWYAEKAKRIDGKLMDTAFPNTEAKVTYEPIGLVAAVTPWNFPLAMVTRKLAPALAAGCGVIIKPSEFTPLSTLAAKILAEKAGIPTDSFQVVCNQNSKDIGLELTTNKKVKKITFTGSTAVGKLLMMQSSTTIKQVALELGGNAPFIVFESADINIAVNSLMMSKFRNAGQVCIAPNRIFVQESIKTEFVEALKVAVNNLKVGDGLTEGITIGPLINKSSVAKIEKHIRNSLDNGARVILGGKPHELGGTFFEPTIIDNMSDDMLTSCEEIFGPVVSVYTFKTEDEVINRVNNTPFGLASYFYSNDVNQIQRVRTNLEVGMVGINTGVLSNESAPFGGIKESGLGREGSDDGIYEFLEAKYSMQSFS